MSLTRQPVAVTLLPPLLGVGRTHVVGRLAARVALARRCADGVACLRWHTQLPPPPPLRSASPAARPPPRGCGKGGGGGGRLVHRLFGFFNAERMGDVAGRHTKAKGE